MKVREARPGSRAGAGPVRAPRGSAERRRRARKALSTSEQYHRALMENANDAIFVVASDGTVLETNRAGEAIHQRRRSEILGRSFLELLAPEDRERVRERFERMLIAGSDRDYPILLRGSGERVPAEVSVSRMEIGGELLTLAIVRDISERKRAAEALAESERKYRELIQNAPIGIYRSARDGQFLDANLAFARKLGYEAVEEVLALDLRKDIYWNADDRERLFAESERLGGIATFEVQLKKKDGMPLWVRLDSRTVRDEAGRTLYCEGFVKDIDHQKRAQARLVAFSNLGRKLSSAETPEEAAYVIAGCADALWHWDSCTVDLYIAERGLVEPLLTVDVLGGRRQAIPPVRVGVAPSPRQLRVLKEGPLLISRDSAPEKSDSIPFGDTARLSACILIVPIHYRTEITGFISVQSYTPRAYDAPDLETLQSLADFCGGAFERIQAAETLRDRERQLREAQRAGQIGSWQWDPRKDSVVWSEEVYRIFGLRPGEFAGTVEGFLECVLPQDREGLRVTIAKALQDRKPYSCEYRVRRPDGRVRVVFARAEAVTNAAGELVRMVGVTQDITERKKGEDALTASRERLKALSRRLIETQETERSRLARELHDEIGQALTAVKINLQAAHPSEEGVELAARIADSLEIVERTMKQVRDISIALRPSLLDDVGLVAALRWYVDSQAQRAALTAHFEADPATIRLPPDLAIGCYRVVQEAVTNVARHAGAGEIWVKLDVRDGDVKIQVRDNGAGFDVVAARERASRGGSFGILSMTERVRLLGGRLEIDSAPGRGTEVRARFPHPSGAA